MGGFLNPDNAFFGVVRKITDIIVLSILWTIVSLPLVTIGAASAGLYYAVVKNIRHERSYPVREFFRGFKDNFWKSTGVWLIVLALGTMLLYGDLPLFASFLKLENTLDGVFVVLFVLKLLIPMVMFLYAFPMMTRFQMRFIDIVEKSVLMAVRYIVRTLPLILLLLATLLLIYIESLLLMLLPGLFCLLSSFLLEPIWKKHTELPAEINADMWYAE